MFDSPALPYDTAAAAAVWRRVAPAIPAYDEAGVPCPAGARCALPRQPGEAGLRQLIDRAAEGRLCCRRCARDAPRMSRAAGVCSEPGGSGARKTGGFCGGKQLDNRE